MAETPTRCPRWTCGRPARWARALLHTLCRPLVGLLATPLRIEGTAHLAGVAPPLLLVANHTSHLDTPFLLHALPLPLRRRVAVAAAADYWYTRPPRAALVSLALNAFPLARQGSPRRGLAACEELARAGWAVLLYPEGTRSRDGALQPFKPGIGLLAARLGATVVPVHLDGAARCLPRGAWWPRRAPLRVRFGAPLHIAAGTPSADAAARIEAAVRALALAG